MELLRFMSYWNREKSYMFLIIIIKKKNIFKFKIF